MSNLVDWGDIPTKNEASKGGGGGSKYLWLKTGNTYKVRPLGKHIVEFCKYYHKEGGRLKTAIVKNPAACPVKASHPDLRCSTRYATYVIDRDDGNIKIMEGPITVFRPFRKRYERTGKSPGGAEGGDWEIEVNGTGLSTTYDNTFLEDTPFVEEEIKKIKEMFKDKDDMKEGLRQNYEAHDVAEIEKRLFGEESEVQDDVQNDFTSSETPKSETPKSDNVDELW